MKDGNEIAAVVTQVSAGAAIAPGVVSVLDWLNGNSNAVLAICAVIGLLISAVAACYQWWLGERKLTVYKRELRRAANHVPDQ